MLKDTRADRCSNKYLKHDLKTFRAQYGSDVMAAVRRYPEILCHPVVRFGALEGRGELSIKAYENDGDYVLWLRERFVSHEGSYDLSARERVYELRHRVFTELNACEFGYLCEVSDPDEALKRIGEIRKGWVYFRADEPCVIEATGGVNTGNHGENESYAIGYEVPVYGVPSGRASKEVYRTYEAAQIALDEGTWTRLERPQHLLRHFIVE